MQNLEIKAVCPDLRRADRLARTQLRAELAGEIRQTDTYFQVPVGRLKLRHNRIGTVSPGLHAESGHELIFYRREDQPTARTSTYYRLPLEDGPASLEFFTTAFGVRVRIDKVRKVYLKDNLRVHLDRVRGLGTFLEFELIVSQRHSLADCRERMNQLLNLFQIAPSDLVKYSYSELKLHRQKGR